MVRAPLANGVGAVTLAFTAMDWIMTFPLNDIAFYLIIAKFVHYTLAEFVRMYVATNDLSYVGEIMTSDYVANEVTTLDSTFLGSFIVQTFIIPFLHQTVRYEVTNNYLSADIYSVLDNLFMSIGLDIQYSLHDFGDLLTGFASLVEPMNDAFILMTYFLTDQTSFRGDFFFFKWIFAYIPIATSFAAWALQQTAVVTKDYYAGLWFGKILADIESFAYMMYPAVLLSVYNFNV